MKLTLAGLDGSGKTTLARLLTTGLVSEHAPTECIRTDKFVWNKILVSIIDSSGDEEIGRSWLDFPCEGYVFIDDGADRSRLGDVQHELKKLFRVKRPIAILLNKSDLVTFCPVPELVRLLGLEEEDPKELPPMQAFECAIAKELGYKEAVEWLVSFRNKDHTH